MAVAGWPLAGALVVSGGVAAGEGVVAEAGTNAVGTIGEADAEAVASFFKSVSRVEIQVATFGCMVLPLISLIISAIPALRSPIAAMS